MKVLITLMTKSLGKKLFFYPEVEGSTQDLAKELAERGEGEGTAVIAESQSKGKGRKGRVWFCPKGSGILLSIILKPRLKPSELLQIPLLAGVGACRAIRRETGLKVGLKWVNDIILLDGKKVGGVLAEMSTSAQKVNYIILGVGINVNRPEGFIFPEDLERKAAFLSDFKGCPISKTSLLNLLLEELEGVYRMFLKQGFEPIREEWKGFNLTLGRTVKVKGLDEELEGEAEDIDNEGALILRLKDKSKRRIISGEASIRTPEGSYI